MDERSQSKYPLSFRDAAAFHAKTLARWKPQSEVWPFTYGNDFAGILSGGCGIYITFFFRDYLKLGRYGRQTCYAPIAALAAVSSHALHTYYITPRILQADSCSICLSTKAGIGQMVLSTAYPLVFSSLICFYLSDKLFTYPVPSLTKAPKEVFQLWWKIVKTQRTPIAFLCGMNFLAAVTLTMEKYKTLDNILQ